MIGFLSSLFPAFLYQHGLWQPETAAQGGRLRPTEQRTEAEPRKACEERLGIGPRLKAMLVKNVEQPPLAGKASA